MLLTVADGAATRSRRQPCHARLDRGIVGCEEPMGRNESSHAGLDEPPGGRISAEDSGKEGPSGASAEATETTSCASCG